MTLSRTFALIALSCASLVSAGMAWSQSEAQAGGGAPQTQTFAGTLVDADCKAADTNGVCEITDATKHFGIMTSDGKYTKFDKDGDSKAKSVLATTAMKTGAIRASVNGKMAGDHIKVVSVQIQ